MASLSPALSSFLAGGREAQLWRDQRHAAAPCPPKGWQRCQAALWQGEMKKMKAGWQGLGGLSVVGGEVKGWSCGWVSGMLSIHAAGSPWVRRDHAVLSSQRAESGSQRAEPGSQGTVG